MTNPEYWAIAATVCTEGELQALKLRDDKHMGTRAITLVLGLSRSTIRDRLASADRKIHHALQENHAHVPAR